MIQRRKSFWCYCIRSWKTMQSLLRDVGIGSEDLKLATCTQAHAVEILCSTTKLHIFKLLCSTHLFITSLIISRSQVTHPSNSSCKEIWSSVRWLIAVVSFAFTAEEGFFFFADIGICTSVVRKKLFGPAHFSLLTLVVVTSNVTPTKYSINI